MKVRTDEDYNLIAKNMQKYGGSFFKHIGKALSVADRINRQKLADKFAREFAKYEEFKKQ